MLRSAGRPLIFALLIGSWIAVAGCGDDEEPTPTPPPAAGSGGQGGSDESTGGTTGGITGGITGGSAPGGAAGAGGEGPSEVPGIATIEMPPMRTTEAGGQKTFRVVLETAPTANVTVPLSSSDESEGTVAPVSLTFTPSNWNAPQIVTVSGVDDDEKDGDQEYSIVLSPAVSSDSAYDGIDPDDVQLVNIDDETAGVTLDDGDGVVTAEDGSQDTFRISLNSQPTANVTFPISSSDVGEGTVSPSSVTFTPNNWRSPQIITVTGVDDDELDGLQPYEIEIGAATSSDAEYDGLAGGSVPAENEDDESPGIRIEGNDRETSESGGTGQVRIRLSAAPSANVTLALSSSDPTEGSVSPVSLLFTPNNWNALQTVTVTGVDDDIADGNQEFRIVTASFVSEDEGYDGLVVPDITFVNVDDDTPGVTVAPLALTTTEAGGTSQFTVVLNSEPFADVSIDIESDNEDEVVASPTTLTFTAMNWNAPQTVTVTGQNDDIDDGNHVVFVRVLATESTDLAYDGIDPPDVEVTNTDDETAGFTVTPQSGLSTGENGDQAQFSVVLNSRPAADVTVMLSSSDPGEGTPSPTTLIFTPDNWAVPQNVTVTGQDDDVDDGAQPYTVVISAAESADESYDGIDPPNVQLTNIDDEAAVITVNPAFGRLTTEAGGTDTFTILLNFEPTADVTIALVSSNPNEGTPSPSTVTFTPADWDIARTITIIGEDDDVADGDQTYTIEIGPAVSTDDTYDGQGARSITVTNADDDTAGIIVNPTSGLVTTEANGTDTFTIILTSEPTAEVTIPLSSSNENEGLPDPLTVTFTPINWDTPRTITVIGVDDSDDDGDQPFSIEVGPAVSADPNYDGRTATEVRVTNADDD